MKLVTEKEWLHRFTNRSNITASFREFMKHAQVRIGSGKLIPLSEYALAQQIDRDNLKLLQEYLVNRSAYLRNFYATSLAPADPHTLHLSPPMPRSEINNNALVNFKNIIRNIHLLDILKRTKSGLAGIPSYLDVVEDFYLREIIDYKILTPSALFYMRQGRLGSVFSSFYFRASIMNPYVVYSINESILKGTRVFTPTLGWSSYVHGFLESAQVLEYVGTDVIPGVCKKTADFVQQYYPARVGDVTIYCDPSQSFLTNRAFLAKYRGHFDAVFFSPPYYELEMYPDTNKKQSTTTFATYEEWLEGYWEKTMQLCAEVLCAGGKMCYILSGYGSDSGGKSLLEDMNKVAKKYFRWNATLPMYNKNVHVSMHRETAEKIMVFTKK
jgi:hypothetical protein